MSKSKENARRQLSPVEKMGVAIGGVVGAVALSQAPVAGETNPFHPPEHPANPVHGEHDGDDHPTHIAPPQEHGEPVHNPEAPITFEYEGSAISITRETPPESPVAVAIPEKPKFTG